MSSSLGIVGPVSESFWAEIAPCEHMAQFYEHDNVFLDTLAGFIGGGLKSGEGAIVIATMEHLGALSSRLQDNGVNVANALSHDQYLPLVAENVLAQFMENHSPDEGLFVDVVSKILARARGDGRRVRAFGEMVALLWARGDHAATIKLEYLWHGLCGKLDFSLLCAYPKAGFTEETSESLSEICLAHSRII